MVPIDKHDHYFDTKEDKRNEYFNNKIYVILLSELYKKSRDGVEMDKILRAISIKLLEMVSVDIPGCREDFSNFLFQMEENFSSDILAYSATDIIYNLTGEKIV